MFFSVSYRNRIRRYMYYVVIMPFHTSSGPQYKFFSSRCERMDFNQPFQVVGDIADGDWKTKIIDCLAKGLGLSTSPTCWSFTPRLIEECKSAYDAVFRHHSGVCVNFQLKICAL